MKAAMVISSLAASAANGRGHLETLNQKWTRRLLISCVASVISSIFGLALAAVSMLGLISRGSVLSKTGPISLGAAFFMLVCVAHCCDRLGDVKRERRIAAFKRKLFND
jgi:hypothetical protein